MTRHDLGDDRRERGAEERLTEAEHRGQRNQMPELERARQGECRDRRRRPGPDDVGRDHDAAAFEPVRDHAPDQHEEPERKRPGQPDQRQRRRRVRELVHLPCNRHDIDPVPDQRDQRAGPEQREVPDPERAENAHPGSGGRSRMSVRGPSAISTWSSSASARSAAASRRASDPRSWIGLQLLPLQLALELSVALEALFREAPLRKCLLDGAARLGLVGTVGEAARRREVEDVGERLVEAALRRPRARARACRACRGRARRSWSGTSSR